MDGRKGGVDGWASVKNAEKDEGPILGIYEPVSNSFIEWHLRGTLRGSNLTDEDVCAVVEKCRPEESRKQGVHYR